MKSIVFRPLRRIKKTGKITVASYMQWRKIKTSDYSKFNLIIDDEYKKMSPDEYVYNHEGELLYFFTFNPAEIPVFEHPKIWEIETIHATTDIRGFRHGDTVNYSGKGIDCDGVPTLNFYTAEYAEKCYQDLNQFEPLTVAMVTKWFGWFIYQLNNSYLQIGK